MTEYSITRKFATAVVRTPRVLDVAESFGLGLSEAEFTVFDGLRLEVNQGDVVYITGQSGSGKSVLLKELRAAMQAEGLKTTAVDEVFLDNDKPVIDQLGDTTAEAIQRLSTCGVNDAYLLIRKPSELSDGQRYRLRLAMLIGEGDDVWVADEFGAVLDRTTAKVVAFNMQKLARKLGKTLLVATTHTDLADELGPDLLINKRYQDRVDITRKG